MNNYYFCSCRGTKKYELYLSDIIELSYQLGLDIELIKNSKMPKCNKEVRVAIGDSVYKIAQEEGGYYNPEGYRDATLDEHLPFLLCTAAEMAGRGKKRIRRALKAFLEKNPPIIDKYFYNCRNGKAPDGWNIPKKI